MAGSVRLTISLPKELAEFAGRSAKQRGQPRSTLFAELLERQRRQEVRQALARAYKALAEDNRQFAQDAFPLAAEIWEPYEDPGDSAPRSRQ